MFGTPAPARAISLVHLTMLEAHPLELIDAAAAGGFDTIGLRVHPPLPTDKMVPVVGDEPLIRAIEQRMDATGIRIFDVETIWLMPHTNVATLAPYMEVAARLGAGHFVVSGNDPDLGRLEANFAGVCELSHAYGLGVAFEPISYVAMSSWRDALAMFRRVRPAGRVSLLIDALHFHRAGGTAAELLEIDPGLLPYLQLCDGSAIPPAPDALRAEGRGGRFYPGEGQLPLGDFLRAMPAGIPIGVEAPCARYAGLPLLERGRICGAATRALLNGVYGSGFTQVAELAA